MEPPKEDYPEVFVLGKTKLDERLLQAEIIFVASRSVQSWYHSKWESMASSGLIVSWHGHLFP